MNLQALMKQAQSMQKNIMDSKAKIEAMDFTGESELVTVIMNGKYELDELLYNVYGRENMPFPPL